jgi:pyruvate dehydrogenase E2 component (dihydrolipoamide acetyltransferase)
MSEHMATARILNWLVKEGDRVELFQPVIEVMTDKVTAEVESPAAGVIKGIRPGAVDGAEVPVGVPLCYIAAPDEPVTALPPLSGYEPPQTAMLERNTEHRPGQSETREQPDLNEAQSKDEVVGVRASPVARRVAKELGVDLDGVEGTGPQGRITEADVRARAAQLSLPQPLPTPAPDASFAYEVQSIGEPLPSAATASHHLDLTPIQMITGDRLRESIVSAPQFALDVSADMTQVLRLRDQLAGRVEAAVGARPSITGFLIMVVAGALTRHPRANAEFIPWQGSSTGGRLRMHPDIHVGVAVGTEDGLIVPVVRNADRMSLAEITRELAGFQEKAKTLRFTADDLSGGNFTLSNLGMYGVDGFRAIVDPAQSAILTAGRILQMPTGMPDGSIALRPMMKLTLTVDYRCMDGLQAARFLSEVRESLEQPYLLLA